MEKKEKKQQKKTKFKFSILPPKEGKDTDLLCFKLSSIDDNQLSEAIEFLENNSIPYGIDSTLAMDTTKYSLYVMRSLETPITTVEESGLFDEEKEYFLKLGKPGLPSVEGSSLSVLSEFFE